MKLVDVVVQVLQSTLLVDHPMDFSEGRNMAICDKENGISTRSEETCKGRERGKEKEAK